MSAPSPYAVQPYTDFASDADALAMLWELSAQPVVNYGSLYERVDRKGVLLEDVTGNVLQRNSRITRDSTTVQHATLNVSYAGELAWGSDMLRVSQLISSRSLNGGVAYRYPLGVYVATAAPRDLQNTNPLYQLTGYDKNYLLQGQLADTFTAITGDKYSDKVLALMQLAGVIAASGEVLSDFVDFSSTWAAKTVPSGGNLIYPAGGGYTHIGVINELLKASGCLPIYMGRTGRWTVQDITDPATDPLRWTFCGGPSPYTPADWPRTSVVLDANRSGGIDAWNRPNSFKYVQRGLTFTPVAGTGMYTYEDTANQTAVGRKIPLTVTLDSSGQADLETQAKEDIRARIFSSEKLSIQTVPWPVAWHYDVFQYADNKLANDPQRRVQVQRLTFPLDGGPTSWECFVVVAI